VDEEREWPPVTLPVIAVAMACGIAASAHAGVAARAPVVWALGAIAVAVGTRWREAGMRRRAACVALAVVIGGGVASRERSRAIEVPAAIVVDDRGEDVVRGVVRGPVSAEGFVVEIEGGGRVLVAGDAGEVLPGDRVDVSGRVREPRGFRNPGGIDRAQVVRDRGAELEMTAEEVGIVERGAEVSGWRWAAMAHRAAAARVAARGGDARGNAIVRAAVVGDRSGIDDATNADWRGAGIFHALSVSGMHLAVVAMLLFGAVRRVWSAVPALVLRVDSGRVAAIAAAPVAVAYTLITGGQTATVRALVVVLAVLGGVLLRRRLRVLDAVALAALLILIDRPSTLRDPSFQLSFTAAVTLSLVARRSRGIRGWLIAAVRVSLWVTATTAPVTAWHFHQVAIAGLVGNVVLTPVVELVVIPAALAGIALGAAGVPGARRLIDLAIALAAIVEDGAHHLAGWIPALHVPPPRPIEIVAWFALLAAIARATRQPWRSRGRWRAACAGCAAVLVLAGSICESVVAPAVREELRITFLDVGQGDAAIIELPGGAVWLVDAGGLPVRASGEIDAATAARRQRAPGEAIRRVLDARRIRRIDLAVISHPHPDHYLGLLALAGEVPITELWTARPPPGEVAPADAGMPTFEAVAATLARRGTWLVHPPLGAARVERDVVLEVLGPVYDDGTGRAPVAAADPVRTVNDNSLIVAIVRAGRRVLFLGDVEHEGEDALVASGAAAADVVKVAHHGSPTSSTRELVAATGARWAIVSCGRSNRFGFPAAEVVDRWTDAGAAVLRTDQRGAITVVVRPEGSLEVTTFDP